MDSLPLETLSFLLQTHLTIDELLSARRVSKRFKFVIENLINYRTLAVYQHSLPINKIWFSTAGQPVLSDANLNQRMRVNSDFRETGERKLRILLSTMLGNLRCLYVSTSFPLSAEFLDGLEHLKRLRVSLSLEREALLNLPNLEMLDLRTPADRSQSKLVLNAKKLAKLRVKSEWIFGHLEFRHPDSITYLESPQFHHKIKQFAPNLEYLFLDNANFEQAQDIDGQFLVPFAKLKELHLNNVQDFETVFKSLTALRERLTPSQDAPKIYLLGVHLDSLPNRLANEWSAFENELTFRLQPEQLRHLLSNYSKSARALPFTSQIDYSCLKDEVIPDDFAEKFVNLDHFEIDDTDNPSHLFGLLKNFKNLVQLTANYTLFGQTFFDSLPSLTPRILTLHLSIPHGRVKCLSFDFLLGFRYLHNFQTNCSCGFKDRSGFKLVKRLFEQLEFLRTFDCSAYGKGFLVKAYPDYGKFFLNKHHNSESFVEFLYNLDQVEYLLYGSSKRNNSCNIF